MYDTPNAEATLANQILAGSDPAKSTFPNDPSQLTTKSFSGSISQATFLPAGGLSDQVVTVWKDKTLTIPWASLNQYLSIMGVIVVAFSLVAAARIVAEGA